MRPIDICSSSHPVPTQTNHKSLIPLWPRRAPRRPCPAGHLASPGYNGLLVVPVPELLHTQHLVRFCRSQDSRPRGPGGHDSLSRRPESRLRMAKPARWSMLAASAAIRRCVRFRACPRPSCAGAAPPLLVPASRSLSCNLLPARPSVLRPLGQGQPWPPVKAHDAKRGPCHLRQPPYGGESLAAASRIFTASMAFAVNRPARLSLSCFPLKGFRRRAPTRPVSRPGRQPATGLPGEYPDRTFTGRRRRAADQVVIAGQPPP
jgi:hypothetical protein